MKFSIVIPTYKRAKYLTKLISSLLIEKDLINEIVVINTSHKDLSIKKPLVKVIKSSNLLSGKNKAIKQCISDWVLILDDDLVLYKNTLKKFNKALTEVKFDAASGVLVQKLSYNNLFLKKCAYGRQTFFKTASLNLSKVPNKTYQANFLPGGFLLVRKSVFSRVGYFDKHYLLPFFNEDTDLTVRMAKSGYVLKVLPNIKTVHLKVTNGGVRRKINSDKWFYAFGFNNAYFYIKNYSILTYLLYSIFNIRDHLFVVKKFSFSLYLSYLKGIFYGVKNGSKLFNN